MNPYMQYTIIPYVTLQTTKARALLERAAKAGHKGAPGTLGYLELNENNNVTGAVHYFNQSHELGDTDATHNLAIIQSFYTPFHPDPVSIYLVGSASGPYFIYNPKSVAKQ